MGLFTSPYSSQTAKRDYGLIAQINRMIVALPRVFVPLFSLLFFVFSVCLGISALVQFAQPILQDGDFVQGLVKGLHTGAVALAVSELAQIVHQEYDRDTPPQDIMDRIRRGVARFRSVVFVALVLESLIMAITYSQHALAGFISYPATLIAGASLLLIALGLFVRLTAAPLESPRS